MNITVTLLLIAFTALSGDVKSFMNDIVHELTDGKSGVVASGRFASNGQSPRVAATDFERAKLEIGKVIDRMPHLN